MSSISKLIPLALSCGLGACSIHPLPEDVTGVNTATIVRKIRCEARAAIIGKALAYLQSEGYRWDENMLRTVSFNTLKKPVGSTLTYFSKTGIVFVFSLDMTESNSLSLQGDVIKPWSHGIFSLSPSLGDALVRDNIRTFTITDNFSDLVKNVDPNYCNFEQASPNFQYPIVGKIGVDEIISTFIDLTLFSDLGATGDAATKATRGPPAMADTISFTTTVSGGLTPKVTLTPVNNNFQIMDATLLATAMRVDRHQVIVSLGLASPPVGLGVPSAPKVTNNGLTPAYISAAPKGSGEAAAVQAANQQILRFEVAKPLIVAPSP